MASTSSDIDTSEMELIKEGHCTALFPKGEVFYNPVQVLNRFVIATRDCDAFTACEYTVYTIMDIHHSP